APTDDPATVGTDGHAVHRKGMTAKRVNLLPGFGIPDLDRLVTTTADNALAITADRDTRDRPAVTGKRVELLAGVAVPDLDGVVAATADNALAVAADRHAVDRRGMTAQGTRFGISVESWRRRFSCSSCRLRLRGSRFVWLGKMFSPTGAVHEILD